MTCSIQGGRLALGPFRLSKLGMASLFLSPFRSEDRRGTLIVDPLSSFEPSFLGGQKTSKSERSKNHVNHAVHRPNMHVV